MYTEDDMKPETIRAEFEYVMDEKVADLSDDDTRKVVATLPEALWTYEQVMHFAQFAKQWPNAKVCMHNYRGLDIVLTKSRRELEKGVIDNEISRRRMANWKEQQEALEKETSSE